MSQAVAFQVAITTTGTSQNLINTAVVNAVTITAKSTNTANVVIGNSASVTATTGYILEKGLSVTIDLRDSNTDTLWIVGTSADVVSVIGA